MVTGRKDAKRRKREKKKKKKIWDKGIRDKDGIGYDEMNWMDDPFT